MSTTPTQHGAPSSRAPSVLIVLSMAVQTPTVDISYDHVHLPQVGSTTDFGPIDNACLEAFSLLLTAKITIPAVKITGTAPSFPDLSGSSDISFLSPQACGSADPQDPIVDPTLDTILDDLEADFFLSPPMMTVETHVIVTPSLETEDAPSGVTDEQDDLLGDFFLDAVDWL